MTLIFNKQSASYESSQQSIQNAMGAVNALYSTLQEVYRMGGISAYERKYGPRSLLRYFDAVNRYKVELVDDLVANYEKENI